MSRALPELALEFSAISNSDAGAKANYCNLYYIMICLLKR